MNPTDWAAQLDDLARLEALEQHHQEGLRLAQDAIAAKRAVIAAAAATTPVLREPEWPEWLPIGRAAQVLGVEKPTLAQRCRRGGVRAGIARKVGGGWQVRIDLLQPGTRTTARISRD